MRNQVWRRLSCFIIIFSVFFVAVGSVFWIRKAAVGIRQREAENILYYYREKIPVSYTHLDVYKRQRLGRLIFYGAFV